MGYADGYSDGNEEGYFEGVWNRWVDGSDDG